MITFNATVTKKHKPSPPVGTRKEAVPPRMQLPRPTPKPPQIVSAPSKEIDPHSFYTYPVLQDLHLQRKSAPPKPAPKAPMPQYRNYAALKTAQMQHEQILSRIRGK